MTTSHPSILVTWADPEAENMGLRVLACGAEHLARSVWGGGTEVVTHSHNTADTMLDRHHVLADLGRRNGALTDRLRRFDAILDTCGGDSFTDIYGLRRLVLLACVHRAARKAGTPVYLSPQTIGPFTSRIGRLLARRVLRDATFVASRDPVSSLCAQSLGRTVDCEATDLAFALPVPPERRRHGVIVNVSGLLWESNPHVDFAFYRREVTNLVASLLDRGQTVGLLAHVVNSGVADDDVPAIDDLRDQFGERVQTYTPESLEDARETLAGAATVVGARLHACLNALSVGTPVVPWAYSRKFEPLMASLSYPYCVDLRSATSPSNDTLRLIDQTSAPRFSATVGIASTGARQRLDDLTLAMRRVVSDDRTVPGIA